MAERVDVVVIGAGMAGMNAAGAASARGRTVAVIERDRVGGTCPLRGCIPSKALIRSAEVAAEMRRAAEFGIRVGDVEVDVPAVMRRVRDIIDRGNRGARAWLESLPGVTIVEGDATVTGPGRVEAAGRVIEAGAIVVATGAAPAVPPIPGLDAVPYLTSDDVFGLDALPARLVAIGAGPIALELGQAIARLGSEVTLLDVVDEILPGADPAAVAAVREGLDRDGVRLRLGVSVRSVRPGPGGGVEVVLADGGVVAGDGLLVATGRPPCVGGLGLEALGVEAGPRGVRVDRTLRTADPGIWAAGDVLGLPYGAFTHVARRLGRVAGENAAGEGPHEADPDVGPRAVFTDPELATIGLTEEAARGRGHDVVVGTGRFSGGRSRAWGVEYGSATIVADRPTRRILGAHIAAHRGADLLHPVVVAMGAPGANLDLLASAAHIHPTLGEVVQGAAAAAVAALGGGG